MKHKEQEEIKKKKEQEKIMMEQEQCSFAPQRLTKHKDDKFHMVKERSVDHFQKLYNDRLTI